MGKNSQLNALSLSLFNQNIEIKISALQKIGYDFWLLFLTWFLGQQSHSDDLIAICFRLLSFVVCRS